MNRTLSGIVLAMLLIGVSTLALDIQPVRAEPATIIVPDDYPTIQSAVDSANYGDTIYVRNGTYNEHISIWSKTNLRIFGEDRNNTIIDGNGIGPVVTIMYGLDVTFAHFTVRNAGLTDWERYNGIRLFLTTSSHVTDCIVSGSAYGIREMTGWGLGGKNVISDNTVSDCTGIAIGSSQAYSIDDIIVNNTITNCHNGIYFNSPYNMQILGNTISNLTGYATYGIHFESGEGSNNTVIGNTVIGYCDYAIAIRYADNNLVSHNTLSNSFYGIELSWSSCGNTVTGNNVSSNGVGISVFRNSNNNLITMNDFSDSVPVDFYISDIGIWVESSPDNTINCNSIRNNGYGLYIPSSSNNRIYHNNIIDNTNQVNSYESTNSWDDGYPSGGNYWSDQYHGESADHFSGPGQDIPGSDGIVDAAYVVDADNKDLYPLMNPWASSPPVASFTCSPMPAIENYPATFDVAASRPGRGRLISYTWDFDDGNVTTTADPATTHIFTSRGTHNVTLTVKNSDYLTDGTWRLVKVRRHDVAAIDAISDRTWTFQGFNVNLNITIVNKGDFPENVNVTLYYNMTANETIGTQNVALDTGENKTVSFVWDTTRVPYCHNYTITAVATIHADSNPPDNTLDNVYVKVRILGDMNGDGTVEGRDIIIVARSFVATPSDPRWNPDADINGDGVVDGRDIVTVARNFGKSRPP